MNKQNYVTCQWFDKVWNEASADAIDTLMTEDAVLHGLEMPNGQTGSEGFRSYFEDFLKQFSDANIEVEHVVREADMEAALTHVHAIDQQTRKPVSFSGLCMIRVKDGKIAEAWNHYDFLGLYQQLGQKLVAAH